MRHQGFAKLQIYGNDRRNLESFSYVNSPHFLFVATRTVDRRPPLSTTEEPIHFHWIFFSVEDLSGYGRSGLEFLLNQLFYRKCIEHKRSTGVDVRIRDVLLFEPSDVQELVGEWLDHVGSVSEVA